VGRGVERVEGLLGKRRGRRRVGIAPFQLLARLPHLVWRVPSAASSCGDNQRMTAGRLADLLLDGMRPFFDGGLARAGRRTGFAIGQRVGDFLLALRQRGRFREGAIERVSVS